VICKCCFQALDCELGRLLPVLVRQYACSRQAQSWTPSVFSAFVDSSIIVTETNKPLLCSADNFANALQWQGEMDADFEGVTVTVANLIHLKYIKGYISQAHRKLVLFRKADKIIDMAFPPLNTVDVSKIGL